MINVGQGDSTLIETPSDQNILIDGGESDQGTDKVIPILQSRGIKAIQKMILTHNHSDHYNGLAEILNSGLFSVGTFYHSEPFANLNSIIGNAVNAAIAAGRLSQVVQLTTTATPTLDFGPELTVKVLHAMFVQNCPAGDNHCINDNSIVLKLTYNQISFLFTGDIEINGSTMVIKNFGSLLPSTIIKVPHHGSNTGLNFAVNFPGRVNAKIGTVSAAGGSFGLPDPDMIAAYESAGTKMFRTDKNGNITFTTDGVTFSVATSVVDSAVKGTKKISNLHLYPNPIKNVSGTISYSLDGKADSAKAKIFTLAGELVRDLDGTADEGNNFIRWDGKNRDGEEVASGLYVVTIEAKIGAASVFEKSRFAVVKKQ